MAEGKDIMGPGIDLRKFFLYGLAASLIISAITGIFILLFGSMGEIQTRILLTTLSIGAFSLTGLASSVKASTPVLSSISKAGKIASFLGFGLSLVLIWIDVSWTDSEFLWKAFFSFLILSFAAAHGSLIQMAYGRHRVTDILIISTLAMIGIVAAMLIFLILLEWDVGDMYFRILGVFAILDVLGTILAPLSGRLMRAAGPAEDHKRASRKK